MNESINLNIQRNENDYALNVQNLETKVKVAKSMEMGGISSISYVDRNGDAQAMPDSENSFLANIFSQTPEKTEKMVNELCLGKTADELKSTCKESLNILNGVTGFIKDNIKTTQETSASNTVSSNSLDALVSKSDFSSLDIRGLMKLLIQAFSQFFSTQRTLDLNTITQIQAAMEAKISVMEKEKDESYKAAMAQAIGSIVSGAISVGAGCLSLAGGALGSLKSKKETPTPSGIVTNADLKNKDSFFTQVKNVAAKVGEGIKTGAQLLGPCNQIANGVAGIMSANYTANAKEAQIEQTKQDAILEVLKKMQQDGSEQTKQLMDYISRLLSMIQELQQSAAQTERTIVQA